MTVFVKIFMLCLNCGVKYEIFIGRNMGNY